MHKQKNEFVIETKDRVVQRIGKSIISQPRTNYTGKGTKWFDDSKLIKKNKE